METYKQSIKEKSRFEIWTHAIESLTARRQESRIIDKDYLIKLTAHVEHELGRELNKTDLSSIHELLDISYGTKQASEMKVAFFCGPEPENDVEVLLSLGVRLENMYAFELGKKEFKQAVASLHGKYPQLKIFNGNIETYSELHNTLFDIVYLDFTDSLLTSFKTICTVLDNNMLAPLSILAVNTTYLDKTDDNIGFLTNYFFYDVMFERGIIEGDEHYENFTPGFGRVESSSCYGWVSPDELRPFVEEHFEEAYSAFQSDFINGYSNITKAIYSVMSQPIVGKRMFKYDRIKDLLCYDKAYQQMDFDYFNDGQTLFSMKFRQSTDEQFKKYFEDREKNRTYSRNQSLKLWELLVNAHYIHQYDLNDQPIGIDEDGNPVYERIDITQFLADALESSISVVEDAIKPYRQPVMFCDPPMIHLWYEMIVNSLGCPYHVNLKNHKRHCYTAKTRKMCVDIFTLDQCRGFYDWLPMIEYMQEYVEDYDKQMITRMCIDAIAKNSLGVIEQQYYGSAIVGYEGEPWVHFYDFPKRIEITDETR